MSDTMISLEALSLKLLSENCEQFSVRYSNNLAKTKSAKNCVIEEQRVISLSGRCYCKAVQIQIGRAELLQVLISHWWPRSEAVLLAPPTFGECIICSLDTGQT